MNRHYHRRAVRDPRFDEIDEFDERFDAEFFDNAGLVTDELDESLDRAIDEATTDILNQTLVSQPTLRIGSRGTAVEELQQRLTLAGFPLVKDGIFGVRTDAAVRSYQRALGLAVDGIVGLNTWAALQDSSPLQDSYPLQDSTWSAADGVVLSPAMRVFLDRFSSAAGGVPIYVTSGIRTPEGQARAMTGKVNAGADRDELLADYYDDRALSEIWPAGHPWSETYAVQVIRAQIARGVFISRHLRADALDIRIIGLSMTEVAALKSAAERLGAETLVESEPPHLHIEGIV